MFQLHQHADVPRLFSLRKIRDKKHQKIIKQEEQGAVISPNFIPLLFTEHPYIIYNASYFIIGNYLR